MSSESGVGMGTTIKVERLTDDKLKSLGVFFWPIWTKEPSTFDWHYDEQERCYFLEGEVTVTPKDDAVGATGQSPVHIVKGDFVTFPKGLGCTWHVKKAVRKHYKFG